jgi:tetratricopeptide (TPR) repeat protein/DNA-binding XRE family transcriptional regulator
MFGDIVRGHRRRLGLSQQELADKSGVTVRGLRKIESGQIATPRPVTVRLLADAFGLVGADRDQFCAAAQPQPAGPPHPATTAPAQLPADVAGFAGRTGPLRELDALLDAAVRQPTAVVITAIAGTAGVGKTALAVHWSHQVRGRFPDGQLYVNLRGFDPADTVMAPAEAIRRFLDALAVPPQRIPADPGTQADLYRTLLADKQVLVVLDNARNPDQVRPLLPGAPGCLVLVTSRNQLASLGAAEGAHHLDLDLLTVGEARDLLTRRLGPARVAAEPGPVDEIIALCARLPLALAIVAANAEVRKHQPLAVFAGQLRDSRDRLGVLSTGDAPATDVRAVFSWSYHTLTADAARLFRLMGLHPGADLSTPAAASLAAGPVERVRALLAELTRANLLTEPTPGRYSYHDLLHAYATHLANTTDTDQQRHAATRRILDHYLHTAHTAARLLQPARDPITLTPPQPGVTPEHPANHEQALEWFTTEHAVLLATVDHATATGLDTHTWQLAWTLWTFLDRRGHWHDYAAIQHAAVAAAGRLADPPVQALAHRYLAGAYIRLGLFNDAHTQLRHALDLATRAGDPAGQANTHHTLAYVWERQGHPVEALDHARQALDLYRAAGHQVGQAQTLNAVGWLHALLGDHRQALTHCQHALTLHQELDNRDGQAATWDSIGYAHHHLGQHTQAIASYRHALDLRRDLGDRYSEADTLTRLGDTHHTTGDPQAARTAWRQALTILDQLDHPDADTVRTKLDHLDHPDP